MNVIITGTTGMVGKGVLLECMDDSRIKKILVINRRKLNLSHPKVTELIHQDFSEFATVEKDLTGFDACFHCMGVSSAGMTEVKFSELTFGITEALARTLVKVNSALVMTYVSGAGTDSSEKGNTMWARVKGKTENLLFNMGFKDVYAFRPGAILPEKGIKSNTALYNIGYILSRPFFPLMRRMKSVTTTSKMGQAMINLCFQPQSLKHLEGKDINQMAEL